MPWLHHIERYAQEEFAEPEWKLAKNDRDMQEKCKTHMKNIVFGLQGDEKAFRQVRNERETQEDPLTWTLAQRTEQRKSHFSRAIFAAFLAEPGSLFTVSA